MDESNSSLATCHSCTSFPHSHQSSASYNASVMSVKLIEINCVSCKKYTWLRVFAYVHFMYKFSSVCLSSQCVCLQSYLSWC